MGKSITIYFIDGGLNGTQYLFISNKIYQIFVVQCCNLSCLNEQESYKKQHSINVKLQNHRFIAGKLNIFKECVKDYDSV